MPKAVAGVPLTTAARDQRLTETFEREGRRLRSFIRKRVADINETEDILQDVFYELVRAERLMEPVEQVGGWLLMVARNRIIDLFRKKQPETFSSQEPWFEDLLPSPERGPDAAYAHAVLVDELEAALDELPAEQRAVFVAHEIEGRSFKELAEETGLSVNTLLARKHYAVRRLRTRLKAIHEEFT